MRIPLLAVLAAALLASCASPADRITAALESRGVPSVQAKCMGTRLADRLDVSQLQRLNQLAKPNRDRAGRLTLNQFLDELNRDGDPKLVSEVVRAGLKCVL